MEQLAAQTKSIHAKRLFKAHWQIVHFILGAPNPAPNDYGC
jgi:hypothetical protein